MREIYKALQAAGLTDSERHFSRTWLRRAGNYAADRGLDHCSPATTLRLMHGLMEARQRDLAQQVLNILIADTDRRVRERRQG